MPVPLTPTTRMTAGLPSCRWVRSARLALVSTWPSSSARSISRTSSGVLVPSTFTFVCRSETICRAGVTPTSAVMRTSSISSQVSSSSRSRESRPSSAVPKPLCDRASRARSRTIRPADGGGFSRVGRAGGGAGSAVRCGGGAVAVVVPLPPPAVSDWESASLTAGIEPVMSSWPFRLRRTPCMPRGRRNIVLPTPMNSTATTTMMMMYSIISAHCLQELLSPTRPEHRRPAFKAPEHITACPREDPVLAQPARRAPIRASAG